MTVARGLSRWALRRNDWIRVQDGNPVVREAIGSENSVWGEGKGVLAQLQYQREKGDSKC